MFRKPPESPRRAGASRQPPPPSQMPTWQALLFGFIAGALIGGLAMAMFFILTREECQTVTITEPAQCDTARIIIPPARDPRPGEEFYHTLPNAAVLIIDDPNDEKRSQGKYEYLLQAGAFKRISDAETQQKNIGLLGIETYIDTVERQNGQQWHRVRIGPFKKKRDAERVKRQLWDKGRIEAARFQRSLPEAP